MEEYKKFLWQMKFGELFGESYLIRKSSKEAVKKALEDGVICEVKKNDVGMPQYSITEKGLKERNV